MIGKFLQLLETHELERLLTERIRPGAYIKTLLTSSGGYVGPCLVGVAFDMIHAVELDPDENPLLTPRQYQLLESVHRGQGAAAIEVTSRYDALANRWCRPRDRQMDMESSIARANTLIRYKVLRILAQRRLTALPTTCREISTHEVSSQDMDVFEALGYPTPRTVSAS